MDYLRFTRKKPVRNKEALMRNDVRLITRKPTPRGIGTYNVGIQKPWMKVSQVGNRFGIVSSSDADCRVMTPTTYGDRRKIRPRMDFRSNLPILSARLATRNFNLTIAMTLKHLP